MSNYHSGYEILLQEKNGRIDELKQTIAELTAKLDAVRGLIGKWKQTPIPEKNPYPVDSWYWARTVIKNRHFHADELLDILDAPTKPKEARNGEE